MKRIFLIASMGVLFQTMSWSQCFMDRHSTNFFDGWVSCEPATNPNPLRPVSHFIQYDFGKTYKLGQMQLWNSNDPSHLDRGLRDVVIDYSTNGQDWQEAGQYTFSQASGLNTYEGFEGPDLQDIEARYLLITAINNYGGNCYGLSELRIHAEEVIISATEDVVTLECVDVTLFPNPFVNEVTVVLSPGCSGDVRYTLYDLNGKALWNRTANLVSGQPQSVTFGRDLPAGAYRLRMEQGGKAIQRNLVKANP